MKKLFIIIGVLTFSFVTGQIKHPKASPFTTISQDIGLTSIKIEYSRPAVRGRKIFGGVVPYGRIWRVGANASTKITFESEVSILGAPLKKGTYAIYAFPDKDEWQIVFHTNIGHWGDGRDKYNPNEDALRLKVVPKAIQEFQENLIITFDKIQHNSLQLIIRWENTEIVIPITIDTDSLMQEEIGSQLKNNPTAQTYYEAARYYQEQNTNYNKALKYLNLAIQKGGDTYYFHRVKSLVEAALGEYDLAIISAQKSIELANLEGKDEFVRMSQENIDLWNDILRKKE